MAVQPSHHRQHADTPVLRLPLSIRDYVKSECGFADSSHEKQDRFYLAEKELVAFWEGAEFTFPARFRRTALILFAITRGRFYHLLESVINYAVEHSSAERQLDDTTLPWDQLESGRLLGDLFAEDFYHVQFLLLEPIKLSHAWPAVIDVDPARCFPFASRIDDLVYSKGSAAAATKTDRQCFLINDPAGGQYKVVCQRLRASRDELQSTRLKARFVYLLRSHANVVKILDVVFRGDCVYTFMLTPSAGSLANLLNGGKHFPDMPLSALPACGSGSLCELDLMSLLPSVQGLCTGINHIYNSGIRDSRYPFDVDLRLEPDNIWLYYDESHRYPAGVWRIVDFDLSLLSPARDSPFDASTTDFRPEAINRLSQHQPHTLVNMTEVGGVVSAQRPVGQYMGNSLEHSQAHFGDVHYHQYFQMPHSETARKPAQSSTSLLDRTYDAPETTFANPRHTQKTLIWSLGCIMLELAILTESMNGSTTIRSWSFSQQHLFRDGLGGRPFFIYESFEDRLPGYDLRPIVRDRIRHLCASSPHRRLMDLIGTMLNIDMAVRPSASEVVTALNGVLGGDDHDYPNRNDSASSLRPDLSSSIKDGEGSRPYDTGPEHGEEEMSNSVTWSHDNALHKLAARVPLESATPEAWCLDVGAGFAMLMQGTGNVQGPSDDFFIRPHTVRSSSWPTTRRYRLPSSLRWQDLRLESHYATAIVNATTNSGDPWYFYADLDSGKRLIFDKLNFDRAGLHQVVPSSNGLVAFCYDHVVYLLAAIGVKPDVLPVSDDNEIYRYACFSKDNQQVFLYIERDTHDHIDVYDIGVGIKATRVGRVNITRHNKHLRYTQIHIYPTYLRSCCIVIQGNLIMAAMAGPATEAIRDSGHPVEIRDNLAMSARSLSIATSGSSLVVIDGKLKVRAYTINTDQTRPVLVSIGKSSIPIASWIWVTVAGEDGYAQKPPGHNFNIVVCDKKGAIHEVGARLTTHEGTSHLEVQEPSHSVISSSSSSSHVSAGKKRPMQFWNS